MMKNSKAQQAREGTLINISPALKAQSHFKAFFGNQFDFCKRLSEVGVKIDLADESLYVSISTQASVKCEERFKIKLSVGNSTSTLATFSQAVAAVRNEIAAEEKEALAEKAAEYMSLESVEAARKLAIVAERDDCSRVVSECAKKGFSDASAGNTGVAMETFNEEKTHAEQRMEENLSRINDEFNQVASLVRTKLTQQPQQKGWKRPAPSSFVSTDRANEAQLETSVESAYAPGPLNSRPASTSIGEVATVTSSPIKVATSTCVGILSPSPKPMSTGTAVGLQSPASSLLNALEKYKTVPTKAPGLGGKGRA